MGHGGPARYYQLEAHALHGLMVALEPRPRGRQVSAERANARQRDEIARLEQEVKRQRALYRMTQRALGVPRVPAPAKLQVRGGKKVKRLRRTTCGERVLAVLSKANLEKDLEVRREQDTGT